MRKHLRLLKWILATLLVLLWWGMDISLGPQFLLWAAVAWLVISGIEGWPHGGYSGWAGGP